MGISVRTGSPLALDIAPPMWKLLVGLPLSVDDLNEIDKDYMNGATEIMLLLSSLPAVILDESCCSCIPRRATAIQVNHNADLLTATVLYLAHIFSLAGINFFRDLPNKEEEFGAIDMPFTTPGAAGQEVPLSSTYHRINLSNRDQYVQSALEYRLHEFDFQV